MPWFCIEALWLLEVLVSMNVTVESLCPVAMQLLCNCYASCNCQAIVVGTAVWFKVSGLVGWSQGWYEGCLVQGSCRSLCCSPWAGPR